MRCFNFIIPNSKNYNILRKQFLFPTKAQTVKIYCKNLNILSFLSLFPSLRLLLWYKHRCEFQYHNKSSGLLKNLLQFYLSPYFISYFACYSLCIYLQVDFHKFFNTSFSIPLTLLLTVYTKTRNSSNCIYMSAHIYLYIHNVYVYIVGYLPIALYCNVNTNNYALYNRYI